jgi:hypothetical protein
VTTGVVVGCVFLAGDQLLGMVQVAVGTSADLINASGLQIHNEGTGNELSGTSLSEKGLERVILNGSTLGLLTIGLNSVLEAEELQSGNCVVRFC